MAILGVLAIIHGIVTGIAFASITSKIDQELLSPWQSVPETGLEEICLVAAFFIAGIFLLTLCVLGKRDDKRF